MAEMLLSTKSSALAERAQSGSVHKPRRVGDGAPLLRRAEKQHKYQVLAFAADHAPGAAPRMVTTIFAGLSLLRLSVPAQARLLRFKVKRGLSQATEETMSLISSRKGRRLVARVFPLLLVLGASVACNLVKGEGSGKDAFSLAPAPELSKSKKADNSKRRENAPWTYVLPVDHGVRADRSGQGHFRAPRFHGEHNGLDLLAPVGTPTFSPCKGKAISSVSQSFGNWVHVICPVPDSFVEKGKPHPWVSFFYAHLDQVELPHNQWVDVGAGQEVGQVGKTGNARGPNIQPHLHLELIVQHNRRTAMDERHLGKDQSNVEAADRFSQVLSEECMAPYGFESKSNQLARARRVDPFIALTCLSDRKPNFVKAPSPLSDASRAWSQFYVAKDFDVDLGVEDSVLAQH